MKNFATHFNQLQSTIENFLPFIEEDPIHYCTLAINSAMAVYEELRTNFIEQELSKEEEIYFFKYDKPKLTSYIIYFNEILKIESNKPVASEKTIRKYYNNHLKKREQFFIDNSEFYNYYRKGHYYLDDKYFLRNQHNFKLGVENFYFQIDKQFATSHDYKVAQILANELLQSYLINKQNNRNSEKIQEQTLKWTGSKVGIIELIYALHTEGVFNHGAADIKVIVNRFSKAFDIEIGQFHRTFHEICNRKSERTKFISSLNQNLITRMNHADI